MRRSYSLPSADSGLTAGTLHQLLIDIIQKWSLHPTRPVEKSHEGHCLDSLLQIHIPVYFHDQMDASYYDNSAKNTILVGHNFDGYNIPGTW